MTLNKITNPPSQKGVIDKVNEIIDSLATVATTGDFTDLSNIPDGATTILVNGTSAGTINANQTSDNAIDLTIPTGVDIDNTTITKNSSDKLQTVGVIDDRSGSALKVWTGTRAQYDSIVTAGTTDSYTLYNITDDSVTTSTSTNFDGQWVLNRTYLASSVQYTAEQEVAYSLASLLPNDNYTYECMFTFWGRTGSTQGSITGCHLYAGSSGGATTVFNCYLGRANSQTSGQSSIFAGTGILPISPNDRYVRYYNEDGVNTSGNCGFIFVGYRRIGTNQ